MHTILALALRGAATGLVLWPRQRRQQSCERTWSNDFTFNVFLLKSSRERTSVLLPLVLNYGIMENVIAFLLPLLVVLSLFLPGAQAFDAGDGVALALGLIIGVLGILACLGAYARRRAGGS